MTDKQIIIDCVDVSGCESFCNGICCKVGFGDDASCKLFSDCHYKNWKRKEQECEELKEQIDDLLHKPEIQDKILWKIDNEALLGSKDAYIYMLEKALTEIREIAEKHKATAHCCYLEDMTEILQKISEVKDGHNG